MKNGIVLPSFVYRPDRVALVAPAFASLQKTVTDDNKPQLLLILKLTDSYYYDSGALQNSFRVDVIPDPPDVKGTEQTLAYGTQKLFDDGCDTVTWMGDDALFHPLWIRKLRLLMQDKPDALAWSVYRSAYQDVHKTLEMEGEYVKVASICGHGMTFTRNEWTTWGVNWRVGFWPSPYGDTLDLHHVWTRTEGERWVTMDSYVEHTGVQGMHCTPAIPEHAVNFQGT